MKTRREFLTDTAAASLVAAAAAPVNQVLGREGSPEPKTPLKTYRVPQTDLVVSRLAYGTSMIGLGAQSSDFAVKTQKAIQTAYDNGITFFDLAPIYGAGISRESILQSVEVSRKNLGTDYLDLLLLHVPDVLVRPEEVAQAFDDLSAAGKVRYFGVSNHGILRIELLKKYLRQPLVVNQIRLGLGYYLPLVEPQSVSDFQYAGIGGIVDYCRLRDIQVQAYSPLKVGDILKPPSLLNPPADATPELRHVAQMLADLAAKKDTNSSAVALAWLLHHPAGIVPIIGATSPAHIVENSAADRVSLSREEWSDLLVASNAIQAREKRMNIDRPCPHLKHGLSRWSSWLSAESSSFDEQSESGQVESRFA